MSWSFKLLTFLHQGVHQQCEFDGGTISISTVWFNSVERSSSWDSLTQDFHLMTYSTLIARVTTESSIAACPFQGPAQLIAHLTAPTIHIRGWKVFGLDYQWIQKESELWASSTMKSRTAGDMETLCSSKTPDAGPISQVLMQHFLAGGWC